MTGVEWLCLALLLLGCGLIARGALMEWRERPKQDRTTGKRPGRTRTRE